MRHWVQYHNVAKMKEPTKEFFIRTNKPVGELCGNTAQPRFFLPYFRSIRRAAPLAFSKYYSCTYVVRASHMARRRL